MSPLRNRYVKAAITRAVVPVLDVLLAPFTLLATLLMKSLRRVGVWRLPATKAVFNAVGVFPIRDHYYEPLFHPRHLRSPLDAERALPGIDFNLEAQLVLLGCFEYREELARVEFDYDNPNFPAGDAEFLYCAIRHYRPARILEVGSGHSTLMMLQAIGANRAADPAYRCHLACVEPYEMPWLERTPGIEVLRQPVETVDPELARALRANDILFIDSSHVLRPQGDVVRIYLELLPLLAPGVLVHAHDIFTPRDYPREWVVDEVRLYNEQYLLEALLTGGHRFRVLAALNLLAHRHPERLAEKFPAFAARRAGCEPGSMWLVSR